MSEFLFRCIASMFLILIFIGLPVQTVALSCHHLFKLKFAYPNFIRAVSKESIHWHDGAIMRVEPPKPGEHRTPEEKLLSPHLFDQVENVCYSLGIPKVVETFAPSDDPGRVRYEPFFKKMYGDSENAVKKHLTTVFWMPGVFGKSYPLLITTVNGVDQKIQQISKALEIWVKTHQNDLPFLANPSTFSWRVIAETHRLSPHSFGIAIDLAPNRANYWQWDLKKAGVPITEDAEIPYHNSMPWEIVPIFERYGFIWGGKWHHYDTMHFEYRPELLMAQQRFDSAPMKVVKARPKTR